MVDGILLNPNVANKQQPDEETVSGSGSETKVISKLKTCNTHVYSKVVEVSLQILFKAWKAWGFTGGESSISQWQDIQGFTDKVVKLVKQVEEKYPANANYTAIAIKL